MSSLPIISSTDDEARLTALAADDADAEALSTILDFLSLPTPADAEDALQAILGRYRSVNPRLDAEPTDAELDALAWAEAMEHVFRGRPSAIVGPIPR